MERASISPSLFETCNFMSNNITFSTKSYTAKLLNFYYKNTVVFQVNTELSCTFKLSNHSLFS